LDLIQNYLIAQSLPCARRFWLRRASRISRLGWVISWSNVCFHFTSFILISPFLSRSMFYFVEFTLRYERDVLIVRSFWPSAMSYMTPVSCTTVASSASIQLEGFEKIELKRHIEP
jgi:hypothetical protein